MEKVEKRQLVTTANELIIHIEAGQGQVEGVLFSTPMSDDLETKEGMIGSFKHKLDLSGKNRKNFLIFTPDSELSPIIIKDADLASGVVAVWSSEDLSQ